MYKVTTIITVINKQNAQEVLFRGKKSFALLWLRCHNILRQWHAGPPILPDVLYFAQNVLASWDFFFFGWVAVFILICIFPVFMVFIKMYLFFLLVFYVKKILQCLEEGSKESDSRKLVLVPYGNGMRELGDYIWASLQLLQ